MKQRSPIQNIGNTSTFRLTLLFGLVFLIAISALLALIYALSARELTSRSDMILHQQAATLRALPRAKLVRQINTEIAQNGAGLSYIALQAADGRHVAGNLRLPGTPKGGRPREGVPARENRVPIRLLVITLPGGERLFVGRDISPVMDLRRRVLAILLYSGVATVILTLLSGIGLSLAPLRRVSQLQMVSRKIASGNLAVRMPISGRGDELDLFAATVNTMVDEMERVIGQVKGVTDAIAHDLRTPLTRVRSQLYRARKLPDLAEPTRLMLAAATDDLDLVLDRFAALLRISQLEAGGQRAGFAAVSLGDMVANVHELYEPLAAERGIDLAVQTMPACVWGDEKLLFEAVSNLVDNAIKFSNDGGRVTIAVGSNAREAIIEVRDNGVGLAIAERQAVLRRFHRGSNAADVPGTGLGLSLVVAIVHLHGFRLTFGDDTTGLTVRIIGARLA